MKFKTVTKKTYPTFGPSVVGVVRNGKPLDLTYVRGANKFEAAKEAMQVGDFDEVTIFNDDNPIVLVERTAKGFVTVGAFGAFGVL